MTTSRNSGLDRHGLSGVEALWNPSMAANVEIAVGRGEGRLTEGGNFLAITAPFTGRSPGDKWLVKESSTEADVWWGKVNRPLDPAQYALLEADVKSYLSSREGLIVRDVYACADETHRLRVRLITESAWHALFANALFIRPALEDLPGFVPDFTILHAPEFYPDPARHGTRVPPVGAPAAAVVLNFATRTILIAGTRYAGEIKKSIFTVLNYLLPKKGVLSMHCSANAGSQGDVALFFGLSGTGKTTLSADPNRGLIGDDEHGWSDSGVFNFEGGCYAKVIRLSPEAEPQIYSTLSRFGTVLENVVMDENTRQLDLDSEAITENTRAAYPLHYIPNYAPAGQAGHPRNVVLLTADAFGVMPPIARLTPEQAKYYFLSGYTAKLAGTERGVTEPQATFSTCFGAPFLVLHPSAYADMFGRKIAEHNTAVWLVNTGWSGGPYGVGRRIRISHTRAMVSAALDGSLDDVPTAPDPVFGVQVPTTCPGVPIEVLKPRGTWADPAAYDAKARELAARFGKNFEEFSGNVSAAVAAAGPRAA